MNYNKLKEYIKLNEGIRLQVYIDTEGFRTIGVGHKLKENENYTKISLAQAVQLFEQDFEIHLEEAKKFPNFENLQEKVQYVIIDMTFNMGGLWWKKWPKFKKAIKDNDINEAIKQIENSQYYHQVGRRAIKNINILRNGIV